MDLLRSLIRPNPNGDWPKIDSASYVDATAQIIGNVRIGPGVYIGPNAVIRADEINENGQVLPIEIGAECNIQDGVIVHALCGSTVAIGRRTSLSHGCIIHGPCIIGDGCFIGFRAAVFNAKLGDGIFVSTGAVVQGVDLAAKTHVPAIAAILSAEDAVRLVGATSVADCRFMKKIVSANLTLTKGYIRLAGQEQKEFAE